MPRNTPTILAIAAALIVGIAVVVLYVIRSSPVHEPVPPALASLKLDAAPARLPAASFVNFAGRPESLRTFQGRVVILNLWATWCAPCVRELPALGRLQTALGAGKVVIVAVNAGRDSAAETAAFLKAHGAGNLAVYRDPELSLLTAFGAQGLPFSVLVDAKGRESARASGPMAWDDPAAIAYFRALAPHAAS